MKLVIQATINLINTSWETPIKKVFLVYTYILKLVDKGASYPSNVL